MCIRDSYLYALHHFLQKKSKASRKICQITWNMIWIPDLGGADCNSSCLGRGGKGVMKEEIKDVEQCYPLFSPELELAEALASTQQKFQTLNFADYKVMRQLLPMTLVCHPTCLGSMVSNPDRRLILFVNWNFLACNG